MLIVGIDAGATKTHVLVTDDHGTPVGGGRGGHANLHTVSEGDMKTHIEDALREALKNTSDSPGVVCLGIAGLDSPTDRVKAERLLQSIFPDIHPSKRLVVNDIVIARRANSNLSFGLCLISGTGSHGYGVSEKGKEVFVGGMDWLLDDEGSGYAIGRAAIRAAVKSEDGRTRSLLGGLVKTEFGVATMREAVDRVYAPGFGKAEIASFSPLVEEAANQGDAVAKKILAEANRELVLIVKTLVRKLKLQKSECELVIAGSQINKCKTLHDAFVAELNKLYPLLRIVQAENYPVTGAARLARDLVGR